MGGREPASVVLATVRWTPVVDELGEQLRGDDELLVVCDTADDPIARREADLPDGARIVCAGEPEACSGKANAVAAGMEAAENDWLVWTDDDFHHPPDWLDTLSDEYERHGPVSEVPVFVGKDPLSMVLEPEYLVDNAIGLYGNDEPWAGSVAFAREDLTVDVATLAATLRTTISDDGILGDYLDVTSVKRTRRVEIGGSIRKSLERHVRFAKIVYRHVPRWLSPVLVAVTVVSTVAALVFPFHVFVIATLGAAGVYAYFGVRRWTFLLAYPALVIDTPLLCYAIARRTFVWGGRRYRWHETFDVSIVGEG